MIALQKPTSRHALAAVSLVSMVSAFNVGCRGQTEDDPTMWPEVAPFPSPDLTAGEALTLPDTLPVAVSDWAPPVPARTGFSVVQTAVFPMPVMLDASTLPGWEGMARDGAVRLVDRQTGERFPVMAELDAYPQDGPPALMVRPLVPLPDGREMAVVLTSGVRDEDGASLSFPWFEALLEGQRVHGGGDAEPAWLDLIDDLRAIDEQDVVMATGFRVQADTAPLQAVVEGSARPDAWDLGELSDGDDVPPRTLRQFRGTYTVTNWLGEDGRIAWNGSTPVADGTIEAELMVHVPASLDGAAAGSAPVWVFGHGIFANPDVYFGDDDDPSGMLALADQAGAIVLATTWRGLTTDDIQVPFGVANDIATFPVMRDHLMQGVSNVASLVALARDGDLLDDPLLEGIADPSVLRYHGISLGGIEGAVLQGVLGGDAPPAVLHVGGGAWSMMLERSTHWALFEDAVSTSGITDPTDRQLAYAATQLWWDPIDPAVWSPQLADRTALWQISVADEQVPNVASWVLLRGAQAAIVEPSPVAVPGLSTVSTPAQGPAASIFDPGFESSDATNRPAVDTPAHETPRLWAGAQAQALRFLDPEDPGVIVAPCGDAPCTTDHTAP